MPAFDVVVVGGGGAGAAAAIAASRLGARVALLSKEPAGYGDTRIAEGGFTYPGRSERDSPELLVNDIMMGGELLSDPLLARTMAEDAESAILDLESFGYLIRRDQDGVVSRKVAKRAGGHSVGRTVDGSGRGVNMGVALRAACARAGISVLEEVMAVRLIRDGARVTGVTTYDLVSGAWLTLQAGAVVLATGGTGWLYYPHTDCVRSATGDGYALALQAGAELIEMEQVQFLPFALTHPAFMLGIYCLESSHAGPHARLLDGDGQVILEGIDRMTRADVTRVMARAIRAGRTGSHGGVFLDLSPNLRHENGRAAHDRLIALGGFGAVRRAQGQKAYAWQEPVEVLPTAHYHMGGVRTDSDGSSRVPGLYAAGAVQGGVHGGNRLGSMALTEIIVFGRRAGAAAAREALARGMPPDQPEPEPPETLATLPGRAGRHRPLELVCRLQRAMWDHVGPLRDEDGLRAGLAEIDRIEADAADLAVAPGGRCNADMRDALELSLMLPTARAIAHSALMRRESRGAHLRDDFPDKDSRLYHTIAGMAAEGRLGVVQAETLP